MFAVRSLSVRVSIILAGCALLVLLAGGDVLAQGPGGDNTYSAWMTQGYEFTPITDANNRPLNTIYGHGTLDYSESVYSGRGWSAYFYLTGLQEGKAYRVRIERTTDPLTLCSMTGHSTNGIIGLGRCTMAHPTTITGITPFRLVETTTGYSLTCSIPAPTPVLVDENGVVVARARQTGQGQSGFPIATQGRYRGLPCPGTDP